MLRLSVVSLALALAVGGASAAPGRAYARPRPQPTAPPPERPAGDELKRKAQELLTEGNRLAGTGDFFAALLKFRAAYELLPSPRLLLNIGTSQRQLGRFAEAATSYEQYLAHPDAEPELSDASRRALDELSKLVGHVAIDAPEAGTRVLLDGRLLSADELAAPVRVDPGSHTLVADKPGRTPTVRQAVVEAGETVQVSLPLAEPGEAAPEPIPVRPIVGYGIAGLGGAAIVVSVIVGVLAGVTNADAEDHCAASGPFAGYCTDEGARLATNAHDLSVAALILGLGGAAVGAAGLTIALTTPAEPVGPAPAEPGPAEPGPTVDIAGWTLRVGGRW